MSKTHHPVHEQRMGHEGPRMVKRPPPGGLWCVVSPLTHPQTRRRGQGMDMRGCVLCGGCESGCKMGAHWPASRQFTTPSPDDVRRGRAMAQTDPQVIPEGAVVTQLSERPLCCCAARLQAGWAAKLTARRGPVARRPLKIVSQQSFEAWGQG